MIRQLYCNLAKFVVIMIVKMMNNLHMIMILMIVNNLHQQKVHDIELAVPPR